MIGIYGGTFNPVHYGHLRSALEVKEIFELDEIRLIPCYQPALKNQPTVSALKRLEMLELAVANHAGFVCDNRELVRQGASYMVDTLALLKDDYPNQNLLLFIGSDAFAGLTQWYQWQTLFDYAHIVVMTRPDAKKIVLNDFFKTRVVNLSSELKHASAGKLYFQNITQLAISSTIIRGLLSAQRSIHFLVPSNVINYIQYNKLYRNINAD